MAVGFLLVHADLGMERELYLALLKVKAVKDVTPLFGEYDFIAKVEAADVEDLGRIILEDIRTLPGVSATRTLAAAGS